MMPMIKIGKDIKNIKIGGRNISKVYKGDKLIWKKIRFEGVEIKTYGSFNFNGNYKDKLPLDFPLKLIIRNDTDSLTVKVNYKEITDLRSGAVFVIKTDNVFTITSKGMLDIKIMETSEQPEYIFE